MRFSQREGHGLTLTPKILRAVEQWLDGKIGIQEFIDLTNCSRTSAYSTIARACRAVRGECYTLEVCQRDRELGPQPLRVGGNVNHGDCGHPLQPRDE
jgi:hypothetical protein